MLSYQHGYHAGNFADVVKHFTLTRILNYINQKDKPYFYLETHSGKGLYSLKDRQALKTGEAEAGVKSLWNHKKSLPDLFQPYLSVLSELNQTAELTQYPGSPYLAARLARPEDRLFCCELHPREYDQLLGLKKLHPKMHLSDSDGLSQLKALLPPPEKRGLIFIDPSFEIKTEYKTIPRLINEAYQRFAGGIYCLWYPLVDHFLSEQLRHGMKQIKAEKSLQVEFNFSPGSSGMSGCGLWIINPPFTLAKELELGLQALTKILNPGQSGFSLHENLKLEK